MYIHMYCNNNAYVYTIIGGIKNGRPKKEKG